MHDPLQQGLSDASIMRAERCKKTKMPSLYERGAKAKQGTMATRLKRMLNLEH
jgi:hypothetical protein